MAVQNGSRRADELRHGEVRRTRAQVRTRADGGCCGCLRGDADALHARSPGPLGGHYPRCGVDADLRVSGSGLLCSTSRARKTAGLDYHDAERFSDRECEIADYHPAFHVCDNLDDIEDSSRENRDGEPTNAFFALDGAVEFFVELGWVRRTARLGLEYIAARLDRCGDPRTAYASLRRDGNGPGWLDIEQDAWLTMLRAMLGDPHSDFAETTRGRGLLLRLVTGEHLNDLFEDHALADAVEAAAPCIKGAGEIHV